MHKDLIAKVLGVTVKSVYNYEKEKRPIIALLEKYYTDEDIIEFLETGNIQRLEENNISNTKLEITEHFLDDNAMYSLKDKIKIYTRKLTEGGGHQLKEILLKALDGIDNQIVETLDVDKSKQTLVSTINGVEITFLKIPLPRKVKSVSTWVEYNLSKLEAYILIKHYKEIFHMIDKEKELKKSAQSLLNW